MSGFKMGTLDHVHLVVPDRAEAARWFRETLGFEVVEEYEVWARVEGGPLHLSADGGKSGIALFEQGPHAAFREEMGVAFSVDAKRFIEFAQGLGQSGIEESAGEPLRRTSVVDFDLCYAFNFQDPYGNKFELNCYDYEVVKRDLIEKEGITPVRYW